MEKMLEVEAKWFSMLPQKNSKEKVETWLFVTGPSP